MAVVNAVRSYLRERGDLVVQLVPPGGQAAISITYKDALGRRRTVYPDLISMHRDMMTIGECKPVFSGSDYIKLLELRQHATEQLKNLWQRFKPSGLTRQVTTQFVLCHLSANPSPVPFVYQWVCLGKIFSIVSPSTV